MIVCHPLVILDGFGEQSDLALHLASCLQGGGKFYLHHSPHLRDKLGLWDIEGINKSKFIYQSYTGHTGSPTRHGLTFICVRNGDRCLHSNSLYRLVIKKVCRFFKDSPAPPLEMG